MESLSGFDTLVMGFVGSSRAPAPACHPQTEGSEQDGTMGCRQGSETRLARAERNRASAARSRIRKKQKHMEFQERARKAEELNRKLKEEVAELAHTLNSLRTQLHAVMDSELHLRPKDPLFCVESKPNRHSEDVADAYSLPLFS